MKNLELEGFGLVEMGKEEMIEIEGGGFFGAVIGAAAAGILYIFGGGGSINGHPVTIEQCMIAGAVIGGLVIPI